MPRKTWPLRKSRRQPLERLFSFLLILLSRVSLLFECPFVVVTRFGTYLTLSHPRGVSGNWCYGSGTTWDERVGCEKGWNCSLALHWQASLLLEPIALSWAPTRLPLIRILPGSNVFSPYGAVEIGLRLPTTVYRTCCQCWA